MFFVFFLNTFLNSKIFNHQIKLHFQHDQSSVCFCDALHRRKAFERAMRQLHFCLHIKLIEPIVTVLEL